MGNIDCVGLDSAVIIPYYSRKTENKKLIKVHMVSAAQITAVLT